MLQGGVKVRAEIAGKTITKKFWKGIHSKVRGYCEREEESSSSDEEGSSSSEDEDEEEDINNDDDGSSYNSELASQDNGEGSDPYADNTSSSSIINEEEASSTLQNSGEEDDEIITIQQQQQLQRLSPTGSSSSNRHHPANNASIQTTPQHVLMDGEIGTQTSRPPSTATTVDNVDDVTQIIDEKAENERRQKNLTQFNLSSSKPTAVGRRSPSPHAQKPNKRHSQRRNTVMNVPVSILQQSSSPPPLSAIKSHVGGPSPIPSYRDSQLSAAERERRELSEQSRILDNERNKIERERVEVEERVEELRREREVFEEERENANASQQQRGDIFPQGVPQSSFMQTISQQQQMPPVPPLVPLQQQQQQQPFQASQTNINASMQNTSQFITPEFQQMQQLLTEQSERMRQLQEQMTASALAQTLEIQRLEQMHDIEMERVRKSHGQQMDRFRLQHTQVGVGQSSGVNTTSVSSMVGAVVGGGIAGPRKAFEASNLPLEQYLQYLEKFQQDASVLTTLEKNWNRQ